MSALENGTQGGADAKRLAKFADLLISGSEGWPSASAAGVPGAWLDRALAARPDLAEAIDAVLAIPGEPDQVLQGVKARDPARFKILSYAVAGAYLMNPKVRKQLGMPSGAPERKPSFPDESDFYLEGGLLDPVIARGGAMFRRTPKTPTSGPGDRQK